MTGLVQPATQQGQQDRQLEHQPAEPQQTMRVAMTPTAMALARSGTVQVHEPEQHPVQGQHAAHSHRGLGTTGLGLGGVRPEERR